MLVRKWASIDDRSPWGDFWFTPVSRFSTSGVRVSPDQAMRLAAVYACVRLLAKTFAVMPFKLWEQSGTGRTPVTNHWLNTLLGKRPNKFQNPYEFRQMIEGHFELRGNAYCVISETAGRITDLLPKHPDRMKAEILPGGSDYRYAYHEPDGSITRYARGEIWHLRTLSVDGIFGINPIEYERDVIGLGLSAQEYGARFFANDATPPGWIEHPGAFKDKTAKDNFRESWQHSQTGANRGKTAVLEGGMQYHQIEVKNSDAQYLESRRFTVSEIARIFGVPPHLIGDLDRATFANIEQQSLEYVMYTMAPIAKAWAASIRYSLLSEDEDDLEPDFGLDELLKGDRASRADFYTKMFQTGAFSTNDIRSQEGENEVDGGDMRFRPTNLSPLRPEDAAKFPTPPPKGGPPQNPDGGEDQDPAPKGARARRAEQLALAAAERLARKELKGIQESKGNVMAFYANHARFVADALGVPIERAIAYCSDQERRFARPGTWSELETRARLVDLALRET